MPRTPGAIIAISSHVAQGAVGNRAMVFALERLGFEVWAVPTVILPHHPGHGLAERIVPEPHAFGRLLDHLVSAGRAGKVAGIISGYFASAEQIDPTVRLVAAVKDARPDALYLCDPVIGDSGGLFVGEATAALVRDELVPRADIATPNAFECRWLSTASAEDTLEAVARRLALPALLVTSAPGLMRGHIGNLLVEDGRTILFEHRSVETPAKGTGDLLAALLLGRRLMGLSLVEAAERAISSVAEIVAATAEAGAPELLLAALQEAIVEPRAAVQVRRLGSLSPGQK